MKNVFKKCLATVAALALFALLIAGAILERNAADERIDPDTIRLGIQQHYEPTQQKQRDEIGNELPRPYAVANRQGLDLRQRWVDAQKDGLIGDTGTLYVPSKYELAYNGTPNEFGTAQITPPVTGWYVRMKLSKNASGRITGDAIAAGSGEENPAPVKLNTPAKRRAGIVH